MNQHTLTPEVIEAAARHFCRFNGKDPDAPFDKKSGLKNWQAAARPVADHALCALALKEALGGDAPSRPSEMEKPVIVPVNFH